MLTKKFTLEDAPDHISLLYYLLHNGHLEPLEAYLKLYPNLDVSDVTIDGKSLWHIFTQEESYARKQPDFSYDSGRKNSADVLAERSQNIITRLFDVLGDPWETPAFSADLETSLNDEHNKKIVGYRDSKRNSFGFIESRALPSDKFSATWQMLFYSRGQSTFNKNLVDRMLSIPSAAKKIQDWHDTYGIHPISYAVSHNNNALLKKYLSLGFSPNTNVVCGDTHSYDGHFPRTSLLPLANNSDITDILFAAGADANQAILNDKKVNLFSFWRDKLSKLDISAEVIRMIHASLDKNWESPDKDINRIVQSSVKGTSAEFTKTLQSIGIEKSFQFRTLDEDNGSPTAFAHFLSLNFPVKRPSYIQAKHLIKHIVSKKQLLDKMSNGETYAFHILNNIKPRYINPTRMNSIDLSYVSIGTELIADHGWQKLFFKPQKNSDNSTVNVVDSNSIQPLVELISSFDFKKPPKIFTDVNVSVERYNSANNWIHGIFDLPMSTYNTISHDGISLRDHIFAFYNNADRHYCNEKLTNPSIKYANCHILTPLFIQQINEMATAFGVERHGVSSSDIQVETALKQYTEETKQAVLSFLVNNLRLTSIDSTTEENMTSNTRVFFKLIKHVHSETLPPQEILLKAKHYSRNMQSLVESTLLSKNLLSESPMKQKTSAL